LAMVYYPSYFS